MDKYSKPTLPSPECIINDLSTLNVDHQREPLSFLAGDENLRDAYKSYSNCKHLQSDITEQQELNTTLEELNRQLMENIENMKKQQCANE